MREAYTSFRASLRKEKRSPYHGGRKTKGRSAGRAKERKRGNISVTRKKKPLGKARVLAVAGSTSSVDRGTGALAKKSGVRDPERNQRSNGKARRRREVEEASADRKKEIRAQ